MAGERKPPRLYPESGSDVPLTWVPKRSIGTLDGLP